VTNAWQQIYKLSASGDELRSIGADASSLFIGHFQVADYASGAGTARVERLDLASGDVTSSLSIERPVNATAFAYPVFSVSSPPILHVATAFYTHDASDTWTALDVGHACDATPLIAMGSELFTATSCASDIVVQAQSSTGWAERWRYTSGASWQSLNTFAATSESVWFTYGANTSDNNTESVVNCSPSQGCVKLADFPGVLSIQGMALDGNGAAYIISESVTPTALRMWRIDGTGTTDLGAVAGYNAALLASGSVIYLARDGTQAECDTINCTVVTRFNGSTWTSLGTADGSSFGPESMVLVGNTLYLGRHLFSSDDDVWAIDVGSKTP
jgi:hypothetical protein